MKSAIETHLAEVNENDMAWGVWLRRQRERLGFSQEAFAARIHRQIIESLQTYPTRLAALHIRSAKSCTGFEISRFEKGARLPAHRHTHLMLLWVLLRDGAVIELEAANAWLESGSQGWLTAREQEALFSF
jgi:hypothetical protein